MSGVCPPFCLAVNIAFPTSPLLLGNATALNDCISLSVKRGENEIWQHINQVGRVCSKGVTV